MRILARNLFVASLFVAGASGILRGIYASWECDAAERSWRERRAEADRACRSERDAALAERDAAVRRAIQSEHEVAAVRLTLEELRRGAIYLPTRPPELGAADLIPAPVEPLPIPTRGERP
jgi:hypothetical protein